MISSAGDTVPRSSCAAEKETSLVEPSTSSANWNPGNSPVPRSGCAQRISARTSEKAEYSVGGSSLDSTTEELLPNSGRAARAKD